MRGSRYTITFPMLLLAAFAVLPLLPADEPVRFTDITAAAGILSLVLIGGRKVLAGRRREWVCSNAETFQRGPEPPS